ncbi:hypothetical protein I5515_16055 [Acinetobacter calcoaceticus]|uniref:hypothetical protein n=1 Tax=Acinetobacter calcoaceticus TaxID=471 RepID=UPI0019005212|nr:hypothetical protein [Acinetobacter calcoaceticus]MBJ9723307.1 hypothetical protein [Acinetobacter calcoaceticus]
MMKKVLMMSMYSALLLAGCNKQFKIVLTDKNGDKKSNYQMTHEQLEQVLKLDSPWNTEVYRDCHMDAVCIDTN